MSFDAFTTRTKPDPFGRLGYGDEITDDADGGAGFVGALRDAWGDNKDIFSNANNNIDDDYVDTTLGADSSRRNGSTPPFISQLPSAGSIIFDGNDNELSTAKRKPSGGLLDNLFNVIDDNFGYEVGRNKPNRRRDVATVETLLHGNGYYDLDKLEGPTGYFSNGLEDAIKNFQTDKNLKKDGYLEPNGETITGLVNNLGQAAMSSVGSLFNNVFSGLSNAASAIGNTVSGAAKGIGDAADIVDDTVGGWFSDNDKDNTVTTTNTGTLSTAVTTDTKPYGLIQRKNNEPPVIEIYNANRHPQHDDVTEKTAPALGQDNKAFNDLIQKTIDEGKNTQPILDGVDDKELKDMISGHEGFKDKLYRDTKGNVTVGVGQMLPNTKAAKDLPFYVSDIDGERLATSKEIEDTFNQIKNGTLKSEKPEIFLKKDFINEKLDSELRKNVTELENNFPNFSSLPPEAKQAVLDMQYNMGSGKFNEDKWPSFYEAIQDGDWDTAALESHRKDVQPDRNDKIYDLLANILE